MLPILRSRVRAIASQKFIRFHAIKSEPASYVQGQSPKPGIREYFYYVNHEGMLFLDDAKIKNFTSCFKDKKFLTSFFKNLKRNSSGSYIQHFPYIYICGHERNFVRCDDVPIVFTNIILDKATKAGTWDFLSCANVDDLLVPFEPSKLYMEIKSGRVYHPAPVKAGGIGLIKSKIAIEISSSFNFGNGEEHSPTHFVWKDKKYILDSAWLQEI